MGEQTKEKSPDMSVSELLREQARLLAKVADYLAEKSAQTAEGEPTAQFQIQFAGVDLPPVPVVVNLSALELSRLIHANIDVQGNHPANVLIVKTLPI